MVWLHRPSPSELNCDDPEFPAQIAVWAAQARCEMKESVAAAKKGIAESRALLAEADRMLAKCC
jgi:hypothetical protein